jgi:hypothetical protein
MKLIALTMALLAVGKVSASYSADLETFYGYICDDHTQVEELTGTTSASYLPYTDNSFFQFITGSALGMQSEQNITDSTCFPQAYQTKEFMDAIADYIYSIITGLISFDFTDLSSDATNLLIQLNNLVIQLSDQNTACQSTLFIKQFAARTQTIPGLFNAIFSLGYGIGYNFLATYVTFLPAGTQQNLNIASLNLFNYVYEYFSAGTLIDCQEFGFNVGLFLSEFLEAKIETTVAFADVQDFIPASSQ